MTSIDISVDLGRDVAEIRERIIREAAISLLREVSPYDPDSRHFTKLGHELRAEISAAIRDEVQRAVAPAVKAALAEGVQRTDTYGAPTGPKVTLRQVIVDEAVKALARKVEVRDNYGRSESVIQQVVRDEVQRAVADDLKGVIKVEREKVKAAVRGKAAEILTESVQRFVA